MPNLCFNHLSLYGPRELLQEFVDAGLSFRKLLGVPAKLLGVEKPTNPNARQLQQRREWMAQYGAASQREWAMLRWGCPSDIGPMEGLTLEGPLGQDGHYKISVEFKSVWGPPVKAFEALYERYKGNGLGVWMEYLEPESQFMGLVTTQSGEFSDEQRGYDDVKELERYSRELEHAIGQKEVQYLRLLDNEQKRDKPEKKPAAKKPAAPKPVAPPAKKPTPTKPLTDVAPKGVLTTTPTPPVTYTANASSTQTVWVPSVWETPKPAAVDIQPALELSKRIAEKLPKLPPLKIESMMKPKGQRPPAPKKAPMGQETPDMKVPSKSSATVAKPPVKPTSKAPAKPAAKPTSKAPAHKVTATKPPAPKVSEAPVKKPVAKKPAPKKSEVLSKAAPPKAVTPPKAAPPKPTLKAVEPKAAVAKPVAAKPVAAKPAPVKAAAPKAAAPKPVVKPVVKSAAPKKAPPQKAVATVEPKPEAEPSAAPVKAATVKALKAPSKK